jgi:hypothetical protein
VQPLAGGAAGFFAGLGYSLVSVLKACSWAGFEPWIPGRYRQGPQVAWRIFMIRMNDSMQMLLHGPPFDLANWDDLPESLREVIRSGWTVNDRGAYLMKALLAGYHGSSLSFEDLTGYEASVNGLGIPDWDFEQNGDIQDRLLRRTISYACYALDAGRRLRESVGLTAVASVSGMLMDIRRLTARVTFILDRVSEPVLVGDVECRKNEALLIFAMEDLPPMKRD